MNYKIKYFTSALFLIVLSTSGCALNKVVVPLSNKTTEKVNSSEATIIIDQQEIYAEIEHSNMAGGMGGGILWALIDSAVDSSRAEDAESEILPIKNKLIDMNVPAILAENYSGKLKNVSWLNIKNYNIENKPINLEGRKKLTSTSQNNAVIFINTKYFLTTDYRSLKVTVDAEMYPNTKELIKLGENNFTEEPMLYKNSYTYTYTIDKDYNLDKVGRINKWASDEGGNIKQALKQGFDSVSNWLANDLKAVKKQQLAKN